MAAAERLLEKVQNLFQMPTCPLIDPFPVQFAVGENANDQICKDLNLGFLVSDNDIVLSPGWLSQSLVLFSLTAFCLINELFNSSPNSDLAVKLDFTTFDNLGEETGCSSISKICVP